MAGGILMHRKNFSKRCIDLRKTLSNICMVRKKPSELAEDETEGNTNVTTLTDLPEDVMFDILMRLPVESLCRLQCVSKTSLDISRSPEFATLHNLRRFAVDSSLMRVTTWYNEGRHGMSVLQTWQSFKYNSTKQTLTKSIRVSQIGLKQDYLVEFVFCNLFFLRTYGVGHPCLLVNPLREEVLELPLSNKIPVATTNVDLYTYKYDWYGMGYDNITSTYKIVHVLATHNCVVAQVLVLGTSSWRQIHLAPPFDVGTSFSGRSKNAIYVGGHMHWMTYKTTQSRRYIVSFSFNREEFGLTLVPSSGYDLSLLEIKGSLGLVVVQWHVIQIWVLQSYDDEKKWELHHNVTMNRLPAWTGIRFREVCAEWEHGICFASADECYFLDLRNLSMKKKKLPPYSTPGYWPSIFWTKKCRVSSIFSYTESLISLKNYGRLQKHSSKARCIGTWIQELTDDVSPVILKCF